MIIKSDSAEKSGVLVAERTQCSLIMIRSRKAHEDKEDMGLAAQSRHIPGCNFEFEVFATDAAENPPTATCAGVPAESACPRITLRLAKWPGAD